MFIDVLGKVASPGTIEGNPVVQVYINADKCFSFVELNSVELTSACLSLDGMRYDLRNGSSIIRIRRPNDFKPELLPTNLRPFPPLNVAAVGLAPAGMGAAGGAPDGPPKLFVGGLPYHLTDDQVKELLTAMGPLKSFHLVREAGSITHKGYGFVEYMEQSASDNAVAGLNGIPLGDKTLTVRVASSGTSGSQQQQAAVVNPLLQAASLYGGLAAGLGVGVGGVAGFGGYAPAAPMGARPTRVRISVLIDYEKAKAELFVTFAAVHR
jgi:splicing factor U2AF subunit